MRNTLFATLVGLLCFSTMQKASATVIGLDDIFESDIEDIFDNTIDFRFSDFSYVTNDFFSGLGAPASDYTHIDTNLELLTLFSGFQSSFNPAQTVLMWFTDSLSFCGGFNVSIAGCAEEPGNSLILETGLVQSSFGTELIAHELGHNLDLGHEEFDASSNNLMAPVLNGDTELLDDQLDLALASSLLQTDGSSPLPFLDIIPIAILSQEDFDAEFAVVPLPATGLLLGVALGIFGFAFGRRRAS